MRSSAVVVVVCAVALLAAARSAEAKSLQSERRTHHQLKQARALVAAAKQAAEARSLEPLASFPAADPATAFLRNGANANGGGGTVETAQGSVNTDLLWLRSYQSWLRFVAGPHPGINSERRGEYEQQLWRADNMAATLYSDNIGDKPTYLLQHFWTHEGHSVRDVLAYLARDPFCGELCSDILLSWLTLYQRMAASADFSYNGLTEHYFNQATGEQWKIAQKIKLALNAARVGACSLLLADARNTVNYILLKDFNGKNILKPLVNTIVYDPGFWHEDTPYKRNYQEEVEKCIGLTIAVLAAPVAEQIQRWDATGADPDDGNALAKIKPDVATVGAYMACVDSSLLNRARDSMKAVQHSIIVSLAGSLFSAIPFVGCFGAGDLVKKLVEYGKKGVDTIAKNAAGQLDAAQKGDILAGALASMDSFEKLWLGIIEAGVDQNKRRRAELISEIYNAKYMMIVGKNLIDWGMESL